MSGQLVRVLNSAIRGVREFAYKPAIPQFKSSEPQRRLRVGLALGGGFARGVAHVGVLKALRESSIPIDAIAGTSAGAIAAAAFASGCSAEEMVTAAHRLRWSRIAGFTFSRLGFATNVRMEAFLLEVLHCREFEELKIPLAVVAADIRTGEAVIFRDGDLIFPVRASCTFPGLFIPVEYRGRQLVDGVVVGSVPVMALREMNVDVTIGVNTSGNGTGANPTSLFQVVGESFQIIQNLNQSNWRSQCDLVIEPEVRSIRWDDFERADALIEAGEKAGRAAIPALRGLLARREAAVPDVQPVRTQPATAVATRPPKILLEPR